MDATLDETQTHGHLQSAIMPRMAPFRTRCTSRIADWNNYASKLGIGDITPTPENYIKMAKGIMNAYIIYTWSRKDAKTLPESMDSQPHSIKNNNAEGLTDSSVNK